jgi:hypothetical protein
MNDMTLKIIVQFYRLYENLLKNGNDNRFL